MSKPVTNPKIQNKNESSTSQSTTLQESHCNKAPQDEAAASTSRCNMDKAIVDGISQQCEKICINDERVQNVFQNSSANFVKKKNAKKKEKLKDLHIQMPSVNACSPPTVQTAPPAYSHDGGNSVHEYFNKHVTQLYANTSARYLENLIHHPQYHLMYSMRLREMFQFQNSQFFGSVPNTPSRPNTLGHYLHNAMQHPLLSKEYLNHVHTNQNQNAFHRAPEKASTNINIKKEINNSPKQNKKQKKDQNGADKVFDAYLCKEEVMEGLKNNSLIEGVLKINPKQFQNSYVSSMDRNEQDILIEGVKNRNRALEGDIVVVQFIESDDEDSEKHNNSDSSSKQRKGRVVFIKEKVHTRKCIGYLKLMPDKNRQRALFVPRDYRIPRLNIPFTSWPDNFYHESKSYENTLFLASIFDWFDVRFALGKLICNIGQSGDMQTETKAILAQMDLDITPFGEDVRHLFPRLDFIIPEEEIRSREDCRHLCIFSIDPINTRDIDDAVSCRKLANGNYEIGVHISDVSYFLHEGTLLDEKVSEKATTIYMVERAYHMLPDELCMLCSLFPGIDKLAFSVFWEITDDGIVLNHRFSRTVIHSCCQLAYDHAQAVLDEKEDAEKSFPEIYNGFTYKDISETIKVLGKISAIFRRRRFDNGALRIDQPKIAFHLSAANGLPDSYWIYESRESHQLIEEFMLLANMTVAKRIHDDHPKLAFLRCHPAPSNYLLKQLEKSLKPLGIDIDISSAGNLHRSLTDYLDQNSLDKGKAMVLSMLCTKPMTRAKYFCAASCVDDDFHHYALNVPLYTHFTSPIRRYADIMVHRLLSASLNYSKVPAWEVDKVRMVAANCNKQKYNAKRAGEMSTELYTLKYIEINSPVTAEAVVVDVKEKYIDVIITAMGLNRRIFFNNDFPGEFLCVKNDAGVRLSKMELTWNETDTLPSVKQVIEVFSLLQVELYKGDDMLKVETKLVRPK
ncbi:DIS3-like exonuclease 2 [Danaus plexippus]|nr:DIS3-like exonuclease 2 [Danaus plexippus]